MSTLRIVLGDQLSRGLSSLRGAGPGDVVLMMEVAEETTYVKHHKQKLVFILCGHAPFRGGASGRRAAGRLRQAR